MDGYTGAISLGHSCIDRHLLTVREKTKAVSLTARLQLACGEAVCVSLG